MWGGEDGSFDPSLGVSSTPEYGKVFISIKSTTGLNLSDAQKSQLSQRPSINLKLHLLLQLLLMQILHLLY